jgi:hypothetical protein
MALAIINGIWSVPFSYTPGTERAVIEFAPLQPARVHWVRGRTIGGFEMKSAVHLHDGLNNLSGEVFPGTEDRADA